MIRGDIDLETDTGMRMLFNLKIRGQKGSDSVGDARRPVGMERFPVMVRIKRRMKMVEQWHGQPSSPRGYFRNYTAPCRSRNIFAANFFEQFQTGLVFAIPWNELGIIVGVALLASLLAALLPAWQAGRVTPIEALRYQ